jgi:hypothetical protein
MCRSTLASAGSLLDFVNNQPDVEIESRSALA